MKISRAWTDTERQYFIDKLERKLKRPVTADQIADLQTRIAFITRNAGFLEANASALFAG